MALVPPTQEAEAVGWKFKASLGNRMRLSPKESQNKQNITTTNPDKTTDAI